MSPPSSGRQTPLRRALQVGGSALLHLGVLGLACFSVLAKEEPPRVIISTGDAAPVMQVSLVPQQESVEHATLPPLSRQKPLFENPPIPEVRVEIGGLVDQTPPGIEVDVADEDSDRPDLVPGPPPEIPVELHLQKRRPTEPDPTSEPPELQASPPVKIPPIQRAEKQGVHRGVAVLDLPVPRYPEASRQRGEQGTVLVKVTVSPSGRAKEVHLARACPYRLLNRAALQAAHKARFAPAIHNGSPVASTLTIPFRFVLQ